MRGFRQYIGPLALMAAGSGLMTLGFCTYPKPEPIPEQELCVESLCIKTDEEKCTATAWVDLPESHGEWHGSLCMKTDKLYETKNFIGREYRMEHSIKGHRRPIDVILSAVERDKNGGPLETQVAGCKELVKGDVSMHSEDHTYTKIQMALPTKCGYKGPWPE